MKKIYWFGIGLLVLTAVVVVGCTTGEAMAGESVKIQTTRSCPICPVICTD